MIRNETPPMQRLQCDGCRAQSDLFKPQDLGAVMAAGGWHDVGPGSHIRGMQFRHLCAACAAAWTHEPAAVDANASTNFTVKRSDK